MLLLLIGCDTSPKNKIEFYGSTKSIDLSDENVKSISLNSTVTDVKNVFGEPDDVTEISSPKSKYILYGGIEFGVIDDEVIRYYFNGNYQTIKEISVGDSKDKVSKAYGKNYYDRVEGGLDMMGYFDKENMINIEFGFNENKVVGVIIEKIGWKENN